MKAERCCLSTLLIAVAGCSASELGAPGSPPPRPIDPALHAGVMISAPSASSRFALGEQVAYVSMLPGTSKEGATATIINLRTGVESATQLVAGGFDPKAVLAGDGDSLRIVVGRAGGAMVETTELVSAGTPLRLVRSVPSGDETGVPVNAGVLAVLSEPVLASSVSASTVSLESSSVQAGVLRVTGDAGSTVEFIPAGSLSVGAAYQLTLGASVRGISGRQLGSHLIVPFRTSSTESLRPVVSVDVEPDHESLILWDHRQLVAHPHDAVGHVLSGYAITWSSSAPAVALVTDAGVVTGVSAGSAVITAMSGGVTGSSTVVVQSRQVTSYLGAVVATVSTTGPDPDTDGYTLVVLGGIDPGNTTPAPITNDGSFLFSGLNAGNRTVWLTGIDPNCDAPESVRPLSLASDLTTPTGFFITCQPRATLPIDDPLIGVWEPVRMEFFRDEALTMRNAERVGDGVSGQLILGSSNGGVRQWQWRFTEPWIAFWTGQRAFGVVEGTLTLAGNTIESTRVREAATACEEYECTPPLIGRQTVDRQGGELVLVGQQSIQYDFDLGESIRLWTRMTFRKVR